MDQSNVNEFEGAFTPTGQVDYLGMANDDSDTVDQLPTIDSVIPTKSDQAVDKPQTRAVGDVKTTLEHLRKVALDHGAVVDGSMESLFKHYCASEVLDTRDIEFFIKGYVFATGSQLAPKIHAATEAMKMEVRTVQKANAALSETIKLLANQAVSVEKEIAALSVNIKSDITSALESVVKGATKNYRSTTVVVPTTRVTPAGTKLEDPKDPNPVPSSLPTGKPSDPTTSEVKKDNYFNRMREVMSTIGVEKSILDIITDDELPVVYPKELIDEYYKDIDDSVVRGILLEEIEKNITDNLLTP